MNLPLSSLLSLLRYVSFHSLYHYLWHPYSDTFSTQMTDNNIIHLDNFDFNAYFNTDLSKELEEEEAEIGEVSLPAEGEGSNGNLTNNVAWVVFHGHEKGVFETW
jgi:hypothetical protein